MIVGLMLRGEITYDARCVPRIFVGRATSENKPGSFIHIPSKGTISCAFITNNVAFGHKYPLASFHMDENSEGVIDSIPQSASTAYLLPGNVSAVDNFLEH